MSYTRGADGGSWGKHQLHGECDRAEWIQWHGRVQCERTASGSDGQFQSDHGNRNGLDYHDGDDREHNAGWKFDTDHHGKQRNLEPSDDGKYQTFSFLVSPCLPIAARHYN